MSEKEKYAVWKKVYGFEGDLAYGLALWGNEIAKREKYKSLNGMDAVHFYLIHKFSWPPAQVRGMSYNDIRFVLQEEMSGFVFPKDAQLK